jgi:hypothetical protein
VEGDAGDARSHSSSQENCRAIRFSASRSFRVRAVTVAGAAGGGGGGSGGGGGERGERGRARGQRARGGHRRHARHGEGAERARPGWWARRRDRRGGPATAGARRSAPAAPPPAALGADSQARLLRGRAELPPEPDSDGGARPPLRPAGGEEDPASPRAPRRGAAAGAGDAGSERRRFRSQSTVSRTRPAGQIRV